MSWGTPSRPAPFSVGAVHELPLRLLAVLLLLPACAAPTELRGAAPSVEADTLDATPLGPAFTDAVAVAADAGGRVYVVDAGERVVLTLSSTGLPVAALGGPGAGGYAFLAPADLDPTNGQVLVVADAGNGRLQRFSNEGRLLDILPVPAVFATEDLRRSGAVGREARPDALDPGGDGRPIAVASAATGELFAVEEVQGVVLRWDGRRELERVVGGADAGEGALREPVDLALGPDGRLFVADRGRAAVLVYDPFGRYLRRIAAGTARGVTAVAVARDRLLLAFPDRVLVYGLDGRLRRALAFDLPQPLVGADATADGLLLLTPSRLYRADALR